jgi:hypothetical protein
LGTFDCKQSFQPFVSQSDRSKYFLNGVPAFTYPGSTFTTPNGTVLPTPPCCAAGTIGNYFGNDASNNYNALQIKVEKRVSQGLQFIAHYTFSRAYGYDSSYYDVDKAVAYGPNPDNRNHAFVMNTVYELPVGKGKKFMSSSGRAMDLALGGWQVTNTMNWSGGLPWTPTIENCGQIADAGPCRPNVVGSQRLKTGVTTNANGTFWFTPVQALNQALPEIPLSTTDLTGMDDSCQTPRPISGPFTMPACGQIGNVGFDSYRGPHVFYDDAALMKNFTITERVKAQFRFDAYNLFNHPVLGFNGNQGNTCVDCGGTAGKITDIEGDNSPGSPTGMRQLQFGFKVIF